MNNNNKFNLPVLSRSGVSKKGFAVFLLPFVIFTLLIFMFSCRSSRISVNDVADDKEMVRDTSGYESGDITIVGALPPLIIYKTRSDYRLLVPVTLDDEKKEIVAFPGPGDLYVQGDLALPVILENGYLLDVRGIGPNTAFLKMTYEEYSSLDFVMSLTELREMILDKDPFVEMYACGNRTNPEEDIALANKLVRKGFNEGCNKIR